MAVCRMKKVLVAGHLDLADEFVRDIQHASILHPEEVPGLAGAFTSPLHEYKFEHYSGENLARLKEIRSFLDSLKGKESLWEKLAFVPRQLSVQNLYDEVSSFNLESLISEGEEAISAINSLTERIAELESRKSEIFSWKDVTVRQSELGRKAGSFSRVIRVNSKFTEISGLSELWDLEILKQHRDISFILIAYHQDYSDSMEEILLQWNFDEMKLPIAGSPAEEYNSLARQISGFEQELESAYRRAEDMLEQYDRMAMITDHYTSMMSREQLPDLWTDTGNAFILGGWVKADDMAKLEALAALRPGVEVTEIEPEPGESPPVALESPPVFSPFQLITRLYSLPAYRGLDPGIVTSVFFVIFFGLCLTDAGYGLVLALVSLWGLKKTGGRGDILRIAFWGGVFTIIAGLLTGGIFGDLFRSDSPFLNLPQAAAVRESLMWFDPMKEPMVFFRLVLLLGVIQVITGQFLGFFSNLRQSKFADAVADNLTWIVILVSSMIVLFSTGICVDMSLVSAKTPPLDSSLTMPAAWSALSMACVILLFGGREEKSLFFRFFIGFLKLFILSGVFSYLGDILSYIRLMALGMVTAGIATAVNTIAFMLADIPVAGYFLTVLVLLAGHLFNLAINVLGGFVHTLRLQYVEFFSKFFEGGGRMFRPLSYENRYVKIIQGDS